MSGSGNTASTLFREVKIFDGRSDQLTDPTDVLITGNTIATISPQVDSPAGDEQRTVIDGAGRVLMPGLIDAHWHAAFAAVSSQVAMTSDRRYLHLVAGRGAGAADARVHDGARCRRPQVRAESAPSTRDSPGRAFSRRARSSPRRRAR